MSVPVRPRWGLTAAQVGAVLVSAAVWVLALAMTNDAPAAGIASLACLGLAVGACAVIEVAKTRAIACEATDAAARGVAGGGPGASEPHAESVRRLTESRRAIVDAFEIERARIERDLHDGAQQYLVAASMKVGEASLVIDEVAGAHPDDARVRAAASLLRGAQDDTDAALAALRETVAGVHSPLLAAEGLEAAVRELAARLGRPGRRIDVRVPHPLPSLPAGVASAAWFFTAEALTNATKHAPGAPVSVVVAADRSLHVSVVDGGPGGARLVAGGGLAGMRERLGAFGGELSLTSPAGGPTSVAARIPLLLAPGEPGIAGLEQEGDRA